MTPKQAKKAATSAKPTSKTVGRPNADRVKAAKADPAAVKKARAKQHADRIQAGVKKAAARKLGADQARRLDQMRTK